MPAAPLDLLAARMAAAPQPRPAEYRDNGYSRRLGQALTRPAITAEGAPARSQTPSRSQTFGSQTAGGSQNSGEKVRSTASSATTGQRPVAEDRPFEDDRPSADSSRPTEHTASAEPSRPAADIPQSNTTSQPDDQPAAKERAPEVAAPEVTAPEAAPAPLPPQGPWVSSDAPSTDTAAIKPDGVPPRPPGTVAQLFTPPTAADAADAVSATVTPAPVSPARSPANTALAASSRVTGPTGLAATLATPTSESVPLNTPDTAGDTTDTAIATHDPNTADAVDVTAAITSLTGADGTAGNVAAGTVATAGSTSAAGVATAASATSSNVTTAERRPTASATTARRQDSANIAPAAAPPNPPATAAPRPAAGNLPTASAAGTALSALSADRPLAPERATDAADVPAPVAVAQASKPAVLTTKTATASTTTVALPPDEAAGLLHQAGSVLRGAAGVERPLRVRLDPPELGTLLVEVSRQGGQVHARFVASSEAALATLRDGLTGLQETLSRAGLTIDRFDLRLAEPTREEPTSRDGNGQSPRHGGEHPTHDQRHSQEQRRESQRRDSKLREEPIPSPRSTVTPSGQRPPVPQHSAARPSLIQDVLDIQV